MEILDDEKEITMYINSAGGSPYSAVGIVDTMRTLRPKIRTVAFGQAATTASLLLAAAAGIFGVSEKRQVCVVCVGGDVCVFCRVFGVLAY